MKRKTDSFFRFCVMTDFAAAKDGHWTVFENRVVTSNLFITCVLHEAYIEKIGEAFDGKTNFNGVQLTWNGSAWDRIDPNGKKSVLPVGTKLSIEPENIPSSFRDMIKHLK